MKRFMLLMLLLMLPMVFAADPGHSAASVGAGTFESGNFVFPNQLDVTGNFVVDTNTLFVNSTSNYVGVGTAAPENELHVAGDTRLVGDIYFTTGYAGNRIDLQGSSGADWYVSGNKRFTVGLGSGVTGHGDGTGLSLLAKLGSGQTGDLFQWQDYSGNVLGVFDNAGNVGIGTTTPARLLDVNSSGATAANFLVASGGSSQGVIKLESSDANGVYINLENTVEELNFGMLGDGQFSIRDTGTTDDLFRVHPGAGDDAFVIDSDGGVAIGKGTAASRLHVYENNTGTNANYGITVEQAGTGDAYLYYLLTGALYWTTGIDNSDGNKFKIGTGGGWSTGEHFVIDTTGNVGIGTSSPGATLDVTGDLILQSGVAVNEFSVDDTLAGNSDSAIPTEQAVKAYVDSQVSGNSLWTNSSGNATYVGGNVGINTTSPSQMLHVVGSARVDSGNVILRSPGGEARIALQNADDTNGGFIDVYRGDETVTVHIDGDNGDASYFNAGDVGIGTSSPTAKLEINSAGTLGTPPNLSNSYLSVTDGSNTLAFDPNQIVSSGDLFLQTSGSGYDIEFVTNDTFGRMIIKDSGYVGINTTSPQYLLDVAGRVEADVYGSGNYTMYPISGDNFAITYGGTGGAEFQVNSDGSNFENAVVRIGSDIYLRGNGTTFFRGGNVAVGQPTASTALDVNGTVTATAFVGDGSALTNLPTTGYWTNSSGNLTYTAGNVGIGTTSPDTSLEVVGGSKFGSTSSSTTYDDHMVILTDASTAWEGGLLLTNVDSGAANTSAVKLSAAYSGASENTDFRLGVVDQDAPNTFLNTWLYGDGSTGRVGIGTTTPGFTLDVNGSINTEGTAPQLRFTDTNANDIRITANSNNLYITNQDTSNEVIRFETDTGRVGIGTSTPSQALEVVGNINTTGNIYYGGNLTGTGADFAERFTMAERVRPGDVVCLDEYQRVSRCTQRSQNAVAGVVSTKATIIGNAAAPNSIPVGIVGIVPTKVVGPINRFDVLTTSDVIGHAEVASAADFGAIIGKAMDECLKETCVIDVLVGLR